LIHEFAHAIHEMGLAKLDDDFNRRLKETYDRAMADGLWKGKYAATNHHEYWAEGVQSYFGTNRQNDHDHNHVDTREELAEYDPALSKLIAEQFGAARWDYLPPKRRAEQPHLRGLDRAKLAAFSWPERLAEESRKLDEIKKRKQENVPASQPR
jgi:hypothetical protein